MPYLRRIFSFLGLIRLYRDASGKVYYKTWLSDDIKPLWYQRVSRS